MREEVSGMNPPKAVGFRILLVIGVTVCLLALVACGGDGEETSSVTSNTTAPTNPPPTLLAVDLKTLLTATQVEAALGEPVGDAELYERDTVICYRTADLQSSAEMALQTGSREAYDVTVALYEDAVVAPNLGEVAHWSAQTNTLLTYGKGYMVSMALDKAGAQGDYNLIAARQLAALVLEALPAV